MLEELGFVCEETYLVDLLDSFGEFEVEEGGKLTHDRVVSEKNFSRLYDELKLHEWAAVYEEDDPQEHRE